MRRLLLAHRLMREKTLQSVNIFAAGEIPPYEKARGDVWLDLVLTSGNVSTMHLRLPDDQMQVWRAGEGKLKPLPHMALMRSTVGLRQRGVNPPDIRKTLRRCNRRRVGRAGGLRRVS